MYYGVCQPEKLFGTDKFCVDCCTTFTSAVFHKQKCPLRCSACCRYGYEYPCNSDGQKIHCIKCNRDFKSIDCFEHHQLAGVCETVFMCPLCGVTDILHVKT